MENLGLIIYLADISEKIQILFLVFGVIFLIISLILILANIEYRDSEDTDDKQEKGWYKMGKVIMPIAVCLLLIATFIPTKQGIYSIAIVNNVKQEHLDKLLNATSRLKDEAKQDVIDIIKEVKK